MRKVLGLASLAIALCFISGCTYSSANLMRAKGDHIKVFGAWGYVDATNASITCYRSMDTISYIKDKGYPKIPTRPTIDEEGTDITIGKSIKTQTPNP